MRTCNAPEHNVHVHGYPACTSQVAALNKIIIIVPKIPSTQNNSISMQAIWKSELIEQLDGQQE
jgi:hypothetical protein